MNRAWILSLLTGVTTMSIKSVGAFLPHRARSSTIGSLLDRVTPLLVPGILAALVVVQVFSVDRTIVIDARAAGLVAAIMGVKLRLPTVVVLFVAAVATALARILYAHALGQP